MRTCLHPRCAILMGVLLFLGTVVCFSPVIECRFTGFDDPAYVTENAQVLSGISTEGISWAFTTIQCTPPTIIPWHGFLTWRTWSCSGSPREDPTWSICSCTLATPFCYFYF